MYIWENEVKESKINKIKCKRNKSCQTKIKEALNDRKTKRLFYSPQTLTFYAGKTVTVPTLNINNDNNTCRNLLVCNIKKKFIPLIMRSTEVGKYFINNAFVSI